MPLDAAPVTHPARQTGPAPRSADDTLAKIARLQRILADNRRRGQWDEAVDGLRAVFGGGRCAVIDGPTIGVPLALRDSDLLRALARRLGRDRSVVARLELMATAWNATFAGSGIWMGKTFEPVTQEVVARLCDDDPATVGGYDPDVYRVGRNFFRRADGHPLQRLALPVLHHVWRLQPRPTGPDTPGFLGELLPSNLVKERAIPYDLTGGLFLAKPRASILPELRGKEVYQLNYRWPALHNRFPQTLLIDEVVQVANGVYLGQLVMATRHFELARLSAPWPGRSRQWVIGQPYHPATHQRAPEYGYQSNGFFLLADAALADAIYSDGLFPHLHPRPGELR